MPSLGAAAIISRRALLFGQNLIKVRTKLGKRFILLAAVAVHAADPRRFEGARAWVDLSLIDVGVHTFIGAPFCGCRWRNAALGGYRCRLEHNNACIQRHLPSVARTVPLYGPSLKCNHYQIQCNNQYFWAHIAISISSSIHFMACKFFKKKKKLKITRHIYCKDLLLPCVLYIFLKLATQNLKLISSTFIWCV